MKIIRRIFIAIIILFVIGYGAYHFGMKYIADKVVEQVGTQLEQSGELTEVKRIIESSPELQEFIQQGEEVNSSSLPFTTKEEAVKVVVKKFKPDEISDITSKVQDGLTIEEQAELMKNIESKLTKEELDALKVIIYKEFNQ